MARHPAYRLGDLQLRIMKVLWELGAADVSKVQGRLGGEPLAYTTVATMLRKMEDRGLVRHHEQGRKFIYQAEVSAETVSRSMADDLVDRFFAGSLSQAVSHLRETRDVDPRELGRLEQLIRMRMKDRQRRKSP